MVNNIFKKYRVVFFIFFCALFVRLFLFFINFHVNGNDLVKTIKADDGYYELSQNIINGHGFSFENSPPYKPNSLRPPLWPYLIALFAYIGGYWLVFVFEILIASFIPVIGYNISKHIVGEHFSLGVAIMMIIEPYSVLLSFLLYSETSFTFLFLLSIYFLIKYFESERVLYWLVWSGIFLGLSILIKPTVQYFPLFIPIYSFLFMRGGLKNKIIGGVTYALIALLIISPWLYRNYSYFKKISLTVQPVFNLYVYLVPSLLSIENKTNFSTEINNYVYKKNVDVLNIGLDNEDYYRDQALPIIKEHRLALIKSVCITVITFFTHDGLLTVLQYSGIRISGNFNVPLILSLSNFSLLKNMFSYYLFSPAVFIVFGRIVWCLITFFFVYGFVRYLLKYNKKSNTILYGLIVIYFSLTTSINGLGVNARFRIPVLVFIFSFTVYGFHAILLSTKQYFIKNEKDFNNSSGL